VRIGKVEGVKLLPDGTAVARIALQPDVELHQDATGQIKSLGLLGDKYVELIPGNPSAPRLADGARIEGGAPSGLDDLTKLAQDIGKDVKSLTSALSASLGGQKGEEKLNKIVDNLGSLSESLRLMVDENRGNVDVTLANLREFSAQMRETLVRVDRILDENRANLKGTVANADQVSEKLKTTADNLNSITEKIDSGKGTIGKLLNDDETHKNLNEALQSVKSGVESLNTTLTRMNRIQLDLGFRGEYMSRASNMKSYFTLDVVPRENKFYRVELSSIPGGLRKDTYITTTTTTPDGQTAEVKQHVETYDDQFGLSFELGYRVKNTILRAGLIESRGGLAMDQNLFGDRLLLSAEGWDWGRKNASPHIKLHSRWNASPNLYVTGGVDDVWNSDVRSLFLGAGIRWKDEDIKTVLPALPLLK
jgi:phospholipid/cholesterol/gamma-HCH transport system substrate-binding protein